MVKVYYKKDIKSGILKGKTIAILGYGSQGHAQANNQRDSGLKVILGLRKSGQSWEKAKEDGFKTYSLVAAAKQADIIHILLPDERHKEVYEEIRKFVTPGKTIVVSHGFNFHFKIISPPPGVNIIMVAPKAPGPTVRREYVNGYGVPGLVAVFKNATGKALETALAIADANGHSKPGIIHTTFKDETETDLFGEQTVLCGGVGELMRAGFDTLVKSGYPPEIAYFECVHEMKLIVDLIYAGGIYGMYKKVSNTAKFGGMTRGPSIVTKETRRTMKKILKNIQSGTFAKEWIEKEYRQNKLAKLNKLLEDVKNWQVETTGRKMRKLAGLEK